MFNDVFNPNLQFLSDLQINPVPLEYKNGMTPTLWLGEMQATLTAILAKVNSWYDEILHDINNGGTLYQDIINHVDSEFTQTLSNLQTQLTTISNSLTMLTTTQINDVTTLNNTITALQTSLQNQINLLNYKLPIATLTSSPSQLIYNVGEAINSIILNFNVTKGSNDLVKAEIYKNNTLIATITNIVNGTNSYVDGNIITSDTDYYIKIYDNTNNILTNHISYKFVYNYYYGTASTSDTINSTFVSSLTSLKTIKSNLNESFICDNNKIVFGYPTPYGDLLGILQDGNNIIGAFQKAVISINSINYNIYVSNNFIYELTLNLVFDMGVL